MRSSGLSLLRFAQSVEPLSLGVGPKRTRLRNYEQHHRNWQKEENPIEQFIPIIGAIVAGLLGIGGVLLNHRLTTARARADSINAAAVALHASFQDELRRIHLWPFERESIHSMLEAALPKHTNAVVAYAALIEPAKSRAFTNDWRKYHTYQTVSPTFLQYMTVAKSREKAEEAQQLAITNINKVLAHAPLR